MLTVGVRDLKNRLSHYLQYVKDGEKVVITEHNKIIAEITLPEKNNGKEIVSIEKKLKQLSREGEIVLAKRNKSCVTIPDTTEKLDWESVYNEVRADRI
jgi:antitoxin (DNA-binding transcriptional repressor) of toxin-antitoxin stability system